MPASRTLPDKPAVLPRGRHPLTQRAVAESQRMRLFAALARVVTQKGYGAATVADVIALAGVSRRTFYELFGSLEDCFLGAYEDGMHGLFSAMTQALRREPEADWQRRTRLAVEAYLQALASLPDAAWAFTVETLGAGRRVLDRRAWVMAQWVARWRALHAWRQQQEPGLPDLPEAQWLALVGGIEELVRECLRRDGAAQLPGLADAAVAVALVMLESPRPIGQP